MQWNTAITTWNAGWRSVLSQPNNLACRKLIWLDALARRRIRLETLVDAHSLWINFPSAKIAAFMELIRLPNLQRLRLKHAPRCGDLGLGGTALEAFAEHLWMSTKLQHLAIVEPLHPTELSGLFHSTLSARLRSLDICGDIRHISCFAQLPCLETLQLVISGKFWRLPLNIADSRAVSVKTLVIKSENIHVEVPGFVLLALLRATSLPTVTTLACYHFSPSVGVVPALVGAAPNLQHLNYYYHFEGPNDLSKLQPLQSATNLTALSVGEIAPDQLSLLPNLPKLQTLSFKLRTAGPQLQWNQLLAPLKQQPSLTALDMNSTSIRPGLLAALPPNIQQVRLRFANLRNTLRALNELDHTTHPHLRIIELRRFNKLTKDAVQQICQLLQNKLPHASLEVITPPTTTKFGIDPAFRT